MQLFASSLVINTVQNPPRVNLKIFHNIHWSCYSSLWFSYCFHIIDTYFLLFYKILKIIKHCAVTAKQQCVVQRWPLPFFTGRLIIDFFFFSAAKKHLKYSRRYSIILNTSTELLPHTHRKTWEGHALKSLCFKFYCSFRFISLS